MSASLRCRNCHYFMSCPPVRHTRDQISKNMKVIRFGHVPSRCQKEINSFLAITCEPTSVWNQPPVWIYQRKTGKITLIIPNLHQQSYLIKCGNLPVCLRGVVLGKKISELNLIAIFLPKRKIGTLTSLKLYFFVHLIPFRLLSQLTDFNKTSSMRNASLNSCTQRIADVRDTHLSYTIHSYCIIPLWRKLRGRLGGWRGGGYMHVLLKYFCRMQNSNMANVRKFP
jgi:hypothetical protein